MGFPRRNWAEILIVDNGDLFIRNYQIVSCPNLLLYMSEIVL